MVRYSRCVICGGVLRIRTLSDSESDSDSTIRWGAEFADHERRLVEPNLLWGADGLPRNMIPLPEHVARFQPKNAQALARTQ